MDSLENTQETNNFSERYEKWAPVLFFAGIAVFTVYDILSDLEEETDYFHLSIELIITFISVWAFVFFLKKTKGLKKSLNEQYSLNSSLKQEALEWRQKHEDHIKGFAGAIDSQLSQWQLSPAEKDVAFMLLKGFSTNEIADLRKVSVKTVKIQSSAIYAKAKISGRAELSAFFLEEIL